MKYRLVILCLTFFMIVLSLLPPDTDSKHRTACRRFPSSLHAETGVADVDAILAAVESGDPQQLRDLIRFTIVG